MAANRQRWTVIAGVGAVVAAAVVVTVAVLAGTWPYEVLGAGDPGALVRVGGPLLRFVVDAAATVCVGSVVYAAFLTRPDPSGSVAPTAYGALRTATRAATVWMLAALTLVPFDGAAQTGLPLHRVLTPGGVGAVIGALESPKAWLVTAAVAGGRGLDRPGSRNIVIAPSPRPRTCPERVLRFVGTLRGRWTTKAGTIPARRPR